MTNYESERPYAVAVSVISRWRGGMYVRNKDGVVARPDQVPADEGVVP